MMAVTLGQAVNCTEGNKGQQSNNVFIFKRDSEAENPLARAVQQDREEFSNLNYALSQSAEPMVSSVKDLNPERIGDTTSKENETESGTDALVIKLMNCLCNFLNRRCHKVQFLPQELIKWLGLIDKALIRWGWQTQHFVSQPNLVFLYMICRSVMSPDIDTEFNMRQELFVCLYLSYSYMGSEVMYPIRPFVLHEDQDEFWNRCLEIIQCTSKDMLNLNTDPEYFAQVYRDLLNEGQ